jgi:hypothetical protein
MTSLRTSIGAAVLIILGVPAQAAPVSDAYCADRVDFAIRTAERRSQGKDQQELSTMVHESQKVFRQQYPDLEEADMQQLVRQVYEGQWTRFIAARNTIRSCAVQLDAAPPAAVAPPPQPEESMDGVRS